MSASEGRLKPKRLALTIASLIGVLAIPRCLHADIVVVDFSGTYFERDNPDSTGTFTGSLTFNNASGTLISGGLLTDRGIPGAAICAIDHCNSAGGVLSFMSFFSSEVFFVEQSSLVGITDLTPMQISGTYGGFTNFNPFFPLAVSFSSIDYTSEVFGVPEPSAISLLAASLVFLFLRKLSLAKPAPVIDVADRSSRR